MSEALNQRTADPTGCKCAESARQRADRALHLLNACNSSMIRATDEERMLADTCRIIAEIGGYRLAWIGYAQHDAGKPLEPVASAGDDSDYAEQAGNSCGPAGAVIRTGRMVIVRDADAEPKFGPWWEAAQGRGFRSSATLPLRDEDRTFGALMICSGEPDAFDTSEAALLGRLADDLAFGIVAKRNALTRDRLAAVLNCAGEAIIGFNASRAIASWNKAAERLFGYTAAEAIGLPLTALVPADLGAEGDALFESFQRGEPVEHLDTTRIMKEGHRISVSMTMRLIDTPDGMQNAGVTVYSDISHRKQSEAALRAAAEQYAAILTATSDGYLLLASDGAVRDANNTYCRLSGYARDELLALNIRDLAAPELRQLVPEHLAQVRADGFGRFESRHRRKDGTIFDVEISKAFWSAADQFVVFVRDITANKAAEAELARHRHHLEELVEARTQQLAQANQELESFAYSVSHDLRAPLRAVDGFSLILQEDYGDRLDAEGQRIVTVIRDGAQRLAQLIDDILAFSRIGRRDLAHAVAKMDDLVDAALKDLEVDLQGRDVELIRATLPAVRGDREMLQRVWMNLLQNAIKFTAKTPKAVIEVGAREEGVHVIYFVRDNGAGFDMQYADKLFRAFQRLHSSTEFPGTGIGLAIVKRIVNRHGGRVWAEGRVGEGATFFFALPSS